MMKTENLCHDLLHQFFFLQNPKEAEELQQQERLSVSNSISYFLFKGSQQFICFLTSKKRCTSAGATQTEKTYTLGELNAQESVLFMRLCLKRRPPQCH